MNLTALREKHKPYKRARKAGPLIPIHNTVRLEMEEPSSSDVGKLILMDIWFVCPPVLLTAMVWCSLGLQDRQYYAPLLPLQLHTPKCPLESSENLAGHTIFFNVKLHL